MAETGLQLPLKVSHELRTPKAELLATLRGGGCLLIMRHANAPAVRPDVAEPDNTIGERQLDVIGKVSARAMGEAMKRLGIGIHQIFSSSSYRARETANLLDFVKAEIVTELDEPAQFDADAQAAWWVHRVAQTPPVGTNLLFVTHLPNILSLFQQAVPVIDPGDVFVLRPDGSLPTPFLARVPVARWSKWREP